MGLRQMIFHVVLIKPTRYDDAGYPIHWTRSPLPSNTLACMWGIVDDCRRRRVLGDDVEIVTTTIDETNARIDHARLIARIRRDGGRALICLVGVQSNQFPRALDIAGFFRAAGLPVAIGGFHVSGCLAMLDSLPPELAKAQELGIGLFAGEAEDGRFDAVLLDAFRGRLAPLYDHLSDLPTLAGQPLPFLPAELVRRTISESSSFDLGRGCPFECSFCCIINVQGRRSRYRTPDDLEAIVRANAAIGIREFFTTDDNLARNKDWEALFDRLILLRERDGLEVSLQIQIDTLAHRTPGFIEKAFKAGVTKLFIGLENINPDNLAIIKKKQNRITEYRDMLLAWKKYPVVITCGYIYGFPGDTRESVLRDIDIIKKELPIDILYLTILTPLPGSADHKRLTAEGVWMDPDLNQYDLSHPVVHHPTMSDEEFASTFAEAWQRFYTPDHVERVMRRAAALGSDKRYTIAHRLFYMGELTRINGEYSLDMGPGRLRYRSERRPTLPLESWPRYFGRVARDFASGYIRAMWVFYSYRRMARRIWSDPERFRYRDAAIAPASETEFESLDLYRETRGGDRAVLKHRADAERLANAKRRS